jgi:hypothetical protein
MTVKAHHASREQKLSSRQCAKKAMLRYADENAMDIEEEEKQTRPPLVYESSA